MTTKISEKNINLNELKKNIDKDKKKKKKKKKKNRCQFKECQIKLKISDMECCSCKKKYCAEHRIKTQHNCPIKEYEDKDIWMKKNGLGGGQFVQLEGI